LFVGAVILVATTILLLKPWTQYASYKLEYLRKNAVELAEAIESKNSIRLKGDWFVEEKTVTIIVSRPRESSIAIKITYHRLIAISPIHEEVVKGKPSKNFEKFRWTSVYINGTHIIVDPKPVVEYVKVLEYGRTVHAVKITLFKVIGQLKRGSTLTFNSTSNSIEYRTYDYSGKSAVTVSGQTAVEYSVGVEDTLKIVVVVEEWVSKP